MGKNTHGPPDPALTEPTLPQSPPGFWQCEPEARGDPPEKHLTSAIFTESLGLGLHDRKARDLQTLQELHGVAEGAPSLGAKIRSGSEGLHNCKPLMAD